MEKQDHEKRCSSGSREREEVRVLEKKSKTEKGEARWFSLQEKAGGGGGGEGGRVNKWGRGEIGGRAATVKQRRGR